jgi:hypothetical protein
MPTYRGKRFTDASLLGLAKIETIRQIALYDTAVTDDGLVAFAARAERLAGFHMSSARLTDRGLSAILNACPIANLQIHDAHGVTDEVAPLLVRHTEITELYLNGTSISDDTAKAIAEMPNVWSFCADGTRVTDSGLANLGRMPALRMVSLNSTRVRGHGLQYLSGLDGLNIYLEDCRVCDDGAAASLPLMAHMRLLSLSKTDVTDRGLASVGACRKLEDLRLSDTGVADATLDVLAETPDLQVLYVERTGVTAHGVSRLKKIKDDLMVYSSFHDEE